MTSSPPHSGRRRRGNPDQGLPAADRPGADESLIEEPVRRPDPGGSWFQAQRPTATGPGPHDDGAFDNGAFDDSAFDDGRYGASAGDTHFGGAPTGDASFTGAPFAGAPFAGGPFDGGRAHDGARAGASHQGGHRPDGPYEGDARYEDALYEPGVYADGPYRADAFEPATYEAPGAGAALPGGSLSGGPLSGGSLPGDELPEDGPSANALPGRAEPAAGRSRRAAARAARAGQDRPVGHRPDEEPSDEHLSDEHRAEPHPAAAGEAPEESGATGQPEEVPALADIPAQRDGQDDAPGYTLAPVPEASWSLDPGRRRSWVSRALLLAILGLQAALSVRLSNTAFQDEALYMYAGHAELSHLLYGTALPKDYNSYFSGSPMLYPIVAAVVENHFAMVGVRVFSLLCMLGSTALLYGFSRRLFNERVALGAAAMFAVTQSTVVLGFFATYDAPAVLLLALSIWIVVRTDRAPAAVVVLAAPVAVLAVGLKYASALYLPSLVLLAVLTGIRNKARQPLLRGLLLAGGAGGLLWAGLTFTDVLSGVQATTTARAHGTEKATELLRQSAEFGGLMFLTACGGAIAYAVRGRMNESPLALALTGPGRKRRIMLGLLLTGTALLAPAYQIHLHTSVALYKHIGFGLLFAAPIAGIGMARLIGPHFRHPQLGILLWVVMLSLGLSQSEWRFNTWPDSSRMVAVLRQHVDANGRYLASADNVPVYYLRDLTLQSQWTSTYGIGYVDKDGKLHSADDGYRTAIADGWFDLIVLDGVATPETDRVVAEAVAQSPHYRLLGRLPFTHVGGTGYYRIWVKQ
ncbi:glycosyltransferase family 39 protein [Streptomyces sp. CB03911]|uniref:glycosyltransferase family 39 protein n=1 Tax=Streptomyces sp. CB03911 TaxID=1804758 RepID=UPI000AB53C98|nr:glycosyltransferase family 39 protein [Streptomyces sp. CB03911]